MGRDRTATLSKVFATFAAGETTIPKVCAATGCAPSVMFSYAFMDQSEVLRLSKVRRAGLAFVKKGAETWNAEKNSAAVNDIKSDFGQVEPTTDHCARGSN